MNSIDRFIINASKHFLKDSVPKWVLTDAAPKKSENKYRIGR